MYLCIHSFINVFLSSIHEEILELEKNLEDLKRNLSALRESSVGKKFCVILGKKIQRCKSHHEIHPLLLETITKPQVVGILISYNRYNLLQNINQDSYPAISA